MAYNDSTRSSRNLVFNLSASGTFSNASPNVSESFSFGEPPGVEIWLPIVLTYSVTFVVGLVGNLLVILSIQKCRRLQNVTNSFLASLATADLIVIVIVIPIQTPAYFSKKWVLGAALCKLLPYLTVLSSSCSVFMLTALSIERYFVIVHPLQAKAYVTPGRARKVIVTLWIVAMAYSFPPLYFKKHQMWDFAGHPVFYTCINSWSNEYLSRVYSLYLLLGMYLIPLFIMAFCYTRIIYELWISRRRCKKLQQRQDQARRDHDGRSPLPARRQNGHPNGVDVVVAVDGVIDGADEIDGEPEWKIQHTALRPKKDTDQGRKQVIVMLIVAVSLFMICWGPLLWFLFAIEFGLTERYSTTRTYLSVAFNLLSYLNSCMNPICYAFISRTFRECFYWAFATGCSGTPPHSTVTTNATKSTATSMYRPVSLQRMTNIEFTITPDVSPMFEKRRSSRPMTLQLTRGYSPDSISAGSPSPSPVMDRLNRQRRKSSPRQSPLAGNKHFLSSPLPSPQSRTHCGAKSNGTDPSKSPLMRKQHDKLRKELSLVEETTEYCGS
ncbi:QRFP-like peptide receptor [Ptychodera flava]|uniref:QRFP-like peptide receptor n=1 Tax=Ptychodera flava TaxID=63121 RepID=UPI00396A8318